MQAFDLSHPPGIPRTYAARRGAQDGRARRDLDERYAHLPAYREAWFVAFTAPPYIEAPRQEMRAMSAADVLWEVRCWGADEYAVLVRAPTYFQARALAAQQTGVDWPKLEVRQRPNPWLPLALAGASLLVAACYLWGR
jgi:hypothetical protein